MSDANTTDGGFYAWYRQGERNLFAVTATGRVFWVYSDDPAIEQDVCVPGPGLPPGSVPADVTPEEAATFAARVRRAWGETIGGRDGGDDARE